MLCALKTAAESYLDAPIAYAEVVVPFVVGYAFLDPLLGACTSLSLDMQLSLMYPASILAARGQGIGGNCSYPGDPSKEDPEQLIFTVEYTRTALAALLVYEECSIFEDQRMRHNPDLGADALSRDRSDGQEKLTSAFCNLARLPLEHGIGAGVPRISELV